MKSPLLQRLFLRAHGTPLALPFRATYAAAVRFVSGRLIGTPGVRAVYLTSGLLDEPIYGLSDIDLVVLVDDPDGYAVLRVVELAAYLKTIVPMLEGLAPFALLLAASALFGEVDPLILGLLGSLDEVARYGLAQKIVAGTLFFPGVLATVYYARHAASDTAESRRVLRQLALLVGAAGLLGALVLALGAGPITALLFPRSPGVAAVAVALSPCILLGGLTILASAAAQAVGRERGALGALVAGALVGLLGDALLVPWRGAVGAALARTAGTLVQLALLAVLLLRARRVAVPSGSP